MIEQMKSSQINDCMQIWLEANLAAHPFISQQYWRKHYKLVSDLLPQAEIWVYMKDNMVKGFIGVVEASYIAGLFVTASDRGQGIGGKLLEYCKQRYPVLALDVYMKNPRAVNFYRQHGFCVKLEQKNSETGEEEYHMYWSRENTML